MIKNIKQHYILIFLVSTGIYSCTAGAPTAPSNNISAGTTTATTTTTTTTGSNTSSDGNIKPYNRPMFAPADSGTTTSGSSTGSTSTSSSGGSPAASSAPTSAPTAAATSTPAPPTNSSIPVGQTGGTSDIKERSTFNGTVYDANGIPAEGAKVNAKSVDANVSWVGEEQISTNGAYVFRNAPVGARIEITVSKDGWTTRVRTEVLKSNLQGDPRANVFDFGGPTPNPQLSTGTTKVTGNIYDGSGKIINVATVIIESLDAGVNFTRTISTVDGSFNISDAPAGIKIRITVRANNKEKQRELILSQNDNLVNFGGTAETDKPFAIAALTGFQVAAGVNPFIDTLIDNLSTFSVDVDTASYTLMRNSILNNDTIPDKKSVRIEEYLNYFDYSYPVPETAKFSINMDMAPSQFDKDNKKLLRIGIQGKAIKSDNRKDAILTFVIDTSGSMADGDKLGLIKESLKVLLKQLKPTDLVGIVSYNSQAKIVLKHTEAIQENKIIEAIDSMVTGSSTNVETGLREGYKLAQQAYKSSVLNRVILCSDGVSNTGISDPTKTLNLAKQASQAGINLSTIGVGFENYNDEFMEKLAVNGDGYYAYVDNIREALRIFVENATDTLQVIAKDAKIQVNFNPQTVRQFRLIGYENKVLANADFRNNKINAGEIGPNHSVTALYEVVLQENAPNAKIADVILRFKDVDASNTPLEINKSIAVNEMKSDFNQAPSSFKLAAAVALYGEILRQSYWAKDNKLENALDFTKSIENELNSPKKVKELISIITKAIQINNSKL